ncbi:MAG: hypothetical protein ACRCU2_22250, partial [Planktothrix sp.]
DWLRSYGGGKFPWTGAEVAAEVYLYQQALYHFREAGEIVAFQRLLWDFDWLQGKLEATDIRALLADFEAVTVGERRDSVLKRVEGALRLSAHVLEQDSSQLAGQLLGRLLSFVEPPQPYRYFWEKIPGLGQYLPKYQASARVQESQGESSSEIEQLLNRAKQWCGNIWFRPLTATLTPPGGPLICTLTRLQWWGKSLLFICIRDTAMDNRFRCELIQEFKELFSQEQTRYVLSDAVIVLSAGSTSQKLLLEDQVRIQFGIDVIQHISKSQLNHKNYATTTNCIPLVLNAASEQLPLMTDFALGCGFPCDQIIPVDCGPLTIANTKTQMYALEKVTRTFSNITIVTSLYHVPRTKRTAQLHLKPTIEFNVIPVPYHRFPFSMFLIRKEINKIEAYSTKNDIKRYLFP